MLQAVRNLIGVVVAQIFSSYYYYYYYYKYLNTSNPQTQPCKAKISTTKQGGSLESQRRINKNKPVKRKQIRMLQS